jgi:hypothetical protein
MSVIWVGTIAAARSESKTCCEKAGTIAGPSTCLTFLDAEFSAYFLCDQFTP